MPNEILSSVRGRITKLALTYGGSPEQRSYLEFFAAHLGENALASTSTKVMIFIGEESAKEDLSASGYFAEESSRHTYQLIQDRALVNPRRWIRDPFIQLVQQKGTQVKLIETDNSEQHPSDRFISEKIAEELNAGLMEVGHFPIDGGNILADDGIVFIGANQFNNWAARHKRPDELGGNAIPRFIKLLDLPEETKVLVISEMMDDNGKAKLLENMNFNTGLFSPALWFNRRVSNKNKKALNANGSAGNSEEIIPHIDLFLTPTGEGKKVFLGEVEVLAIGDADKPTLDRAGKVNGYLADVESHLMREGLEVIRMPLPLIFDSDAPDDWFFCFYNNCLVENAGDFKRVWLPYVSSTGTLSKYKNLLESVELKVQALWNGIGFINIMWVPNELYESDMHAKGAIHCITKEVTRA